MRIEVAPEDAALYFTYPVLRARGRLLDEI
jgi:hypothetical protein